MSPDANKTNKLLRLRLLGWLMVVLMLAGAVLLAVYVPGVLVVMFLSLLIVATVLHSKSKGFWSGMRLFFKEIIWGW